MLFRSWPLAIFCIFVCGWRWSYDLSWSDRFLVNNGVLFHWQVWFVAAALLHLIGVGLARYAEPGPGADERSALPPEGLRARGIPEPPQTQIP